MSGLAFLVPIAVIVPFGGLIADRVSRKILCGTGLILINLSLFVTAYAENYSTVFAMRVILGTGAGLFLPGVLSLIVDLFPPGHQTKALASLSMAAAIGSSLGYEQPILFGKLGWKEVF